MDLATGKRNRVAVAQLVRRTLKEIEPHARELGAERELEGVRDILARGQRLRPPAAHLQREPRHRRGRERDRERDGDRARAGVGTVPGQARSDARDCPGTCCDARRRMDLDANFPS